MLLLLFILLENLLLFIIIFLMRVRKKRDAFNQIDYIAKITHDLRTPIFTINGFILLARTNPLNTNNYLSKIEVITNKMLNVVNDSIEYSKIKNRKLVINKKENNIIECINLCLANIEALLINKGISLFKEIAIIHQNAFFDAEKLYIILINLISNSYKYTNSNGNIYFKVKEEQYTYIFEIEDTGIGMSKEYLKNIFKPFSKGARIINDDVSSSGLGMAILKEIVDLMKGSIKIESKENVGTKVILKFCFDNGKGV